jgi:molybdate transport system regulatory protein
MGIIYIKTGEMIKVILDGLSHMVLICRMADKQGSYSMRTKIWIEDRNGKVVFGAGRFRILESVARHGSLSEAAKELGMSYRAVWGKIKATEERLGRQLLRKQTGGASGGGSALTPFAVNLLQSYRKLQSQTREKADSFFRDVFAGNLEGTPKTKKISAKDYRKRPQV